MAFKIKSSVASDLIPPIISITTPPAGSTIISSTVSIQGIASDPQSGVNRVEVGLDGQTMVPAIGSTSWSKNFPVSEGFHVITAKAYDNAGNASEIITSSFRAQLTVPPPPPPPNGPPPPPPPTTTVRHSTISIRSYGLAGEWLPGIAAVSIVSSTGEIFNGITPITDALAYPIQSDKSYTVTVSSTSSLYVFDNWEARPNPTNPAQGISVNNDPNIPYNPLSYNARFRPTGSSVPPPPPPPPPGTGLAGTLLINSYIQGTSSPIIAPFDISAGNDVANGVLTPATYNVNTGEPFIVTMRAPAGYHFVQWGTAPPVGTEAWRTNPVRSGNLAVPIPPAVAQITFTAYFALG